MIDYEIIRKDTDSIVAHVLDNGKVEVHLPFEVPDQAAEDVVMMIMIHLSLSRL